MDTADAKAADSATTITTTTTTTTTTQTSPILAGTESSSELPSSQESNNNNYNHKSKHNDPVVLKIPNIHALEILDTDSSGSVRNRERKRKGTPTNKVHSDSDSEMYPDSHLLKDEPREGEYMHMIDSEMEAIEKNRSLNSRNATSWEYVHWGEDGRSGQIQTVNLNRNLCKIGGEAKMTMLKLNQIANAAVNRTAKNGGMVTMATDEINKGDDDDDDDEADLVRVSEKLSFTFEFHCL